MNSDFTDLIESVNFIKDNMATKADVRAIVHDVVPGIVAIENRPIVDELGDFNRRLDSLDEHYRNMRGFSKELDWLRDEIRAIKRHLGLATDIMV